MRDYQGGVKNSLSQSATVARAAISAGIMTDAELFYAYGDDLLNHFASSKTQLDAGVRGDTVL